MIKCKKIAKTNIFFLLNELFLKNILFMVFISILLSNLNVILCDSYITLKINKSGIHSFLFKGGVQDPNLECYNIDMHTPTSININDNNINIDNSGEYDFTREENIIKLYYPEDKENYECLFYKCYDIMK